MQEIIIKDNEAGQRFDKFLFKYFKEASAGFIYKMLRKKNIILNGSKSNGKEKLNPGDHVKIFMADETIEKFRGMAVDTVWPLTPHSLEILYEDADVLIVNKPSGMLSQKAEPKDISLNEYIISYLLESGQFYKEELRTFKPSICNRLDRNTSGLIVAGKSLKGLQEMSEMFRDRTMDKYYLAIVYGKLTKKQNIKGYLAKDKQTNKVTVCGQKKEDARYIETAYEPLATGKEITLLKVKLITGRTHQIRAHLASIGHGIIGDFKYGNKEINEWYRTKYGLKDQLLHGWKIKFPKMEGAGSQLSEREITAPPPEIFDIIIREHLERGQV